jgi:hypothetical protein
MQSATRCPYFPSHSATLHARLPRRERGIFRELDFVDGHPQTSLLRGKRRRSGNSATGMSVAFTVVKPGGFMNRLLVIGLW